MTHEQARLIAQVRERLGERAQLLGEFFAGQMAVGHMRKADPLAAARALGCLCMGGLHQRVIWGIAEPSPETVDAEAQGAADIFAHAFEIARPNEA